jgi:serine/threonine protein kinase
VARIMNRFFSYIKSFWTAWRDYPEEQGHLLANRFRIQAFLGEGSYGLTYQCIDIEDESIIAVKKAKPSKGLLAKNLLLRESAILQSLDHPLIPSCKALLHEGRDTFLAMSYFSGDTIEQLIFEKGRQFREQACVQIASQLLELVTYLHARGIVHLDLRIPNVLFKDGELYLIDFGLARRIGEPPEPKLPTSHWFKHFSMLTSAPHKTAEEQSDLEDIGHFMLFMLYSTYEPLEERSHSDERSWREELPISEALKTILERLLRLSEPYSGTKEFARDLRKIKSTKPGLLG